MAKVATSISIEADVKEKAISLLSELGLDLSTAVGMFLRQTIRENGIPFDVSLNMPNATTRTAMNNAANGVDMFGPFDSVAALMEDLNA